jgi:hypothetical protein
MVMMSPTILLTIPVMLSVLAVVVLWVWAMRVAGLAIAGWTDNADTTTDRVALVNNLMF